jgi:hypothetical protein
MQKNGVIQKYTIEWLREEYSLDDPFIDIMGKRPQTTTKHPDRDIDYILTYGIQASGISMLTLDYPASSDHRGMCIDIDIQQYFYAPYGTLGPTNPRLLTMGNVQAKTKHEKYIKEQFLHHKLWDRAEELNKISYTQPFEAAKIKELLTIDDQITFILKAGERQCAKRKRDRNEWSPKLVKNR